MRNRPVVALASIIVILISGALLFRTSLVPSVTDIIQSEPVSAPARAGENFTVLTSTQLAAMLQKKDFFFVNVHIPYEGEIQGTDAFIPYDTITDNLEKLPNDKNTKIVLYCKSGRMSEIAARELVRLGYTHVSHLAGGMIDWKKSGYEIHEK